MRNPPAPVLTPAPKLKLTPPERHASLMLALLFAVRMLGLFLLTPVFAVAALSVPGGDNATKVGLALGAYGRRTIVVAGMLLFVLGALVCALGNRIEWIIVGRTIQGLGAVSAAITAWVADATRPEVRTRAMAMVGGSIGLSFAVSLVLAPVLTGHFGLPGLFWAMTALGGLCLLIAVRGVPAVAADANTDANTATDATAAAPAPPRLRDVLRHADLLRLNLGVFCLHFILMALFMVVPGLLVQQGGLETAQLWRVYLPVILLSFVLMVPLIFLMETRRWHNQTLQAAIIALAAVLALMAFFEYRVVEYSAGTENATGLTALFACLVAFFVAFNVLEALQPSLVSRLAPPTSKGMALGLFNTAQALGVFMGASLAGLLTARMTTATGSTLILTLLAALALLWAWVNRGLDKGRQAKPCVDRAA